MRHLHAYDGKRVRLRGVVDECSGGVCSLCTGWIRQAAQPCLWIGWWDLARPSRDKDSLDRDQRGDGAANRALDAVFRFSEVTVTARINEYQQPDDPTGMVDFDLSRYSVAPLQDVAVDIVHERRPATRGLTTGPTELIKRVSIDTARQITRDLGPTLFPVDWRSELIDTLDTPDNAMRAFFSPEDPRRAWVCVMDDEDAPETAWPRRRTDLIPASANPYACTEVEQGDGDRWRRAGP